MGSRCRRAGALGRAGGREPRTGGRRLFGRQRPPRPDRPRDPWRAPLRRDRCARRTGVGGAMYPHSPARTLRGRGRRARRPARLGASSAGGSRLGRAPLHQGCRRTARHGSGRARAVGARRAPAGGPQGPGRRSSLPPLRRARAKAGRPGGLDQGRGAPPSGGEPPLPAHAGQRRAARVAATGAPAPHADRLLGDRRRRKEHPDAPPDRAPPAARHLRGGRSGQMRSALRESFPGLAFPGGR